MIPPPYLTTDGAYSNVLPAYLMPVHSYIFGMKMELIFCVLYLQFYYVLCMVL